MLGLGVDSRALQIVLDDGLQDWRGIRHAEERLFLNVVGVDGFSRGQPMVARQGRRRAVPG
jgi:hypothetical protein